MTEKVKKSEKSGRNCPRWDSSGGWIKSARPGPKKGPDATATAPETATQGFTKNGGAFVEGP